MSKVASVVFCLAVLCVSPPAALRGQGQKSAKVDVTGTWKVEVDVGGQTGSPVFTLKQKGDKVTGKYKGSFGEQDVTGTVKGNKIEFGFTVDEGKVVYTGTVDKQTMKGECKYGDLTGTWTAKREKDKGEARPASGSGSATGVEKTTFHYATRGSQKLHLDRIVDPTVKAVGKRPVIIFSVGGGWEGGGRDDRGLAPFLNHLASLGYTVVSIDYRLGIKEAKARKEFTPANGVEMYLRAIQWGVEDLYDATSYVLKHADEWNIDKDQIVICGGSAGATNSLVAEFNVANDTALARAHLPKGFRYAGVISMAGAFWLKAGTPLTFKSKPAPILFFHGAKDQLVTYDEVQGAFSGYGPAYYFRKFPGPDYPKWFVDYPEGDHIVAATPTIDCRHEMAAFLQKLVKERQQVSVHTVVREKTPRTFGNYLKLHGDRSPTGGDAPAKKWGPGKGKAKKSGAVPAKGAPGAEGKPIPIWPGVAPGSEGWTQKEVESRGWGEKTVRNVTTPTLTAFLPDPSAATGAAVIVCPGGGFRFLSWENEGTKVAEWLRKHGVAAFVLKYRLKETPAADDAFRKDMGSFLLTLLQFKDRDLASDAARALEKDMRVAGAAGCADGRQAVKVVRQRAREWGIKPDRIGIMGFSAGGIVTRAAATDYDADSRPDFAAHVYAPVFGEVKVPKDAPPLFVLCAADDQLAESSSVRLYEAWRAAGRPAELHLYEKGGHGFGMAQRGLPVDGWVERLGDWLRQRGFMKVGG